MSTFEQKGGKLETPGDLYETSPFTRIVIIMNTRRKVEWLTNSLKLHKHNWTIMFSIVMEVPVFLFLVYVVLIYTNIFLIKEI